MPLNQSFGFIVEGESLVPAIPVLLQSTGISMMKVVQFGGQPQDCSQERFRAFISEKISRHVKSMLLSNPRKIIVLIDRENRDECPGEFANSIKSIIDNDTGNTGRVTVVCADRKFENWLIADPIGLRSHAYIDKSLRNAVGNNADSKDAEQIIKRCYRSGKSYDKRMHAYQLAAKVRVTLPEVRQRSRSLNKLLKVCGIRFPLP